MDAPTHQLIALRAADRLALATLAHPRATRALREQATQLRAEIADALTLSTCWRVDQHERHPVLRQGQWVTCDGLGRADG